MSDARVAGTYLTVVIRNVAPLVLFGDTPSYRTIRVDLTAEQIDALRMPSVGMSGGTPIYEEVSKVILEGSGSIEEK